VGESFRHVSRESKDPDLESRALEAKITTVMDVVVSLKRL
jgi:hypothetical protein